MKVRSLLIAAALGAFATAAAAVTDSISANDQAISNNSVTANSVTASKAGYLAVHTITGPHIGRMLGVVAVKAGENSDVSVPLTAAVKAGKNSSSFCTKSLTAIPCSIPETSSWSWTGSS